MGLVRQNPWTPTKRRGPIAAEAASPGPAVVALPSFIGNSLKNCRRRLYGPELKRLHGKARERRIHSLGL